MVSNPVWEICEHVAVVQALLDDHLAGGKHSAADWLRRRKRSCRNPTCCGQCPLSAISRPTRRPGLDSKFDRAYLSAMVLLRERKSRLVGFIEPCLPSPAKAPPSGPEWIHEIKHDGFRIIARRDAAGVRLITRKGNDLTRRFPFIAMAVAALPAQSCLIDGEAIVISATTMGLPSSTESAGTAHCRVPYIAHSICSKSTVGICVGSPSRRASGRSPSCCAGPIQAWSSITTTRLAPMRRKQTRDQGVIVLRDHDNGVV
jgi:ATP dependent DNA ligase domain